MDIQEADNISQIFLGYFEVQISLDLEHLKFKRFSSYLCANIGTKQACRSKQWPKEVFDEAHTKE